MKNIIRTALALSLVTIALSSVSAQSGNRTTVGVPFVPPQAKAAIVQTAEARKCGLHCGSMAATNMKRVPTATEQQVRADACGDKMIRNR